MNGPVEVTATLDPARRAVVLSIKREFDIVPIEATMAFLDIKELAAQILATENTIERQALAARRPTAPQLVRA